LSLSRDVRATLAIVGLFVLLAAGRPLARRWSRHPTAERCVAMLDRYAEQQARSYERVPPRDPLPRAEGAPEVVRCTRELTDDEVTCALAAGYVDAMERCLP
jgi:hypothetical protein